MTGNTSFTPTFTSALKVYDFTTNSWVSSSDIVVKAYNANASVGSVYQSTIGIGVAGNTTNPANTSIARELGYDASLKKSETIDIKLNMTDEVKSATFTLSAFYGGENGVGERGEWIAYRDGHEVGRQIFIATLNSSNESVVTVGNIHCGFDEVKFVALPYVNQGCKLSDSSDFYIKNMTVSYDKQDPLPIYNSHNITGPGTGHVYNPVFDKPLTYANASLNFTNTSWQSAAGIVVTPFNADGSIGSISQTGSGIGVAAQTTVPTNAGIALEMGYNPSNGLSEKLVVEFQNKTVTSATVTLGAFAGGENGVGEAGEWIAYNGVNVVGHQDFNANSGSTLTIAAADVPGGFDKLVFFALPYANQNSTGTASQVKINDSSDYYVQNINYTYLSADPTAAAPIVSAELHLGAGHQTVIVPATTHEVYAEGGYNTVTMNNGTNVLHGGAGHNTLNANGSNNLIYSEGGYNHINVQHGDNTIDSGAGHDVITMDTGTNTVYGGVGYDTIQAGAGTYTIYGGGGNNTITTGSGSNFVDTQGGHSTVNTGSGDATIMGGVGYNTITAGSGKTDVNAGAGHNTITTTTGKDFIDAQGGYNTINTGSGSTQILGGVGHNTIHAGSGSTEIYDQGGFNTITTTSSGSLVIHGGEGHDTITLMSGSNAVIHAGEGNNVINVGSKQAVVYGDCGFNTFNGTANNDVFVFEENMGQPINPMNIVVPASAQFGSTPFASVTDVLSTASETVKGNGGKDALVLRGADWNVTISSGANTHVGNTWTATGSSTLVGEAKNSVTGAEVHFSSMEKILIV